MANRTAGVENADVLLNIHQPPTHTTSPQRAAAASRSQGGRMKTRRKLSRSGELSRSCVGEFIHIWAPKGDTVFIPLQLTWESSPSS